MMTETQEKFSRAIREVLRANSSRGLTIGANYPGQDTSDMVRRTFDISGTPDLGIQGAGQKLYECAMACLKDFRWEHDYDQLTGWMERPDGRGVLISGGPGTGKTFLATIFATLAYMYHGALFTIATAQEMNDRAEELRRDRFLMIDDIGVEDVRNNYGNRSYVLSELVDVAERKGSILVLTTNLDASQIAAKYGHRTFDRLHTLVRPISFACTPSHRLDGRRTSFPVPKLRTRPLNAVGVSALQSVWAEIPEEERYALEERVIEPAGRDKEVIYVPMHPLTHFAYLLGLTDRDIPLPTF